MSGHDPFAHTFGKRIEDSSDGKPQRQKKPPARTLINEDAYQALQNQRRLQKEFLAKHPELPIEPAADDNAEIFDRV